MASKLSISTVGALAGAKLLPIEMDMLAQATGQKQQFTGGWFGPGEPMQTQGPADEKGRQFDYSTLINTGPRPRGEAGEDAIDFETLRRLAEPSRGGLDLLRGAIETCKDQMAAQKWTIKGRDGKDGGDEAKRIADLLEQPDGVNDFQTWQRMILEDHYVIDQVCIFPRKTTKGYFLPQIVDGGRIKRIVGEDGRVPLPPFPAYQHHMHGMAAWDYTADELIVRSYNMRSNRIYALGPVEQSVNIINLALRRMLHQTEYYTSGSIPDAILEAAPGLSPDQVKDFQNWWDALLVGQTAMRRHGIWVPAGTKVQSPKQEDLTGAVDEWLARLICWIFSVAPQALIKQQNRATAQTAKETAEQEGIEPRKLWFQGFMNTVIRRCYGAKISAFA